MTSQWALWVADLFSIRPYAFVLYLLVATPIAVLVSYLLARRRAGFRASVIAASPLALMIGVAPIGFGHGSGLVLIPVWVYALIGLPVLPLAAAIFLFWEGIALLCVVAAKKILAR